MKLRTKEQTLGYLYRAGLFSELITTAHTYTEQDPDDIDAWNYLAAGLLRAGYTDAAQAVTQKIVAKKPLSPRAYQNHGVVLAQAGRIEQAAEALKIACSLSPSDPWALNNLAALLIYQGHIDEAIDKLGELLQRYPRYSSAWSNLGVAYTFKDNLEEAARCINNSIRLKPDSHRILSMRATSLMGLERYEDALSYFLVKMDEEKYKDNDFTNLAYVLNENGLLDDAEVILEKVLERDPNNSIALMNLSVTQMEKGNIERSEQLSWEVLGATDSPTPQAYLNLGLSLLAQGNLEHGWFYYNKRMIRDDLKLPLKEWEGEDLTGKNIVVISEQGVGDEIRWISMLPDLAQKAKKVKFVGIEKLSSLVSRSIETCECYPAKYSITQNDPDHFQIPLGSLSRFLRPNLDSFRKQEPYLVPDPEFAKSWVNKLREKTSMPTVGICWRSMNLVGKRKTLYTQLDEWGPIFSIKDVKFVNLQYGDCEDELLAAEDKFGVEIIRWPEVDLKDDMETAAALTNAVDVVVSANTSVADLAGALGKPTFMYGAPRSQLTLGQDHVPWYKTVSLVPFGIYRDPEEMLTEMAQRLTDYFSRLPQ